MKILIFALCLLPVLMLYYQFYFKKFNSREKNIAIGLIIVALAYGFSRVYILEGLDLFKYFVNFENFLL